MKPIAASVFARALQAAAAVLESRERMVFGLQSVHDAQRKLLMAPSVSTEHTGTVERAPTALGSSDADARWLLLAGC